MAVPCCGGVRSASLAYFSAYGIPSQRSTQRCPWTIPSVSLCQGPSGIPHSQILIQISNRCHHAICSASSRTSRLPRAWKVRCLSLPFQTALFTDLNRIMESTLRTVNNLLERLHASFFFYLLTSPDEFIVIGKYLTSAVLVGISLELNGLHGWVASGWQEFNSMAESGKRVPRPIVPVLIIMMATHIFGALFGASMTTSPVSRALEVRDGIFWRTSRSELTDLPLRVQHLSPSLLAFYGWYRLPLPTWWRGQTSTPRECSPFSAR